MNNPNGEGMTIVKKFELIDDQFIEESGVKLLRIRALVPFARVCTGDIGGYAEKEENLSQADNAWVFGSARVYGNAQVSGNAWVFGNAQVSGSARVCEDVHVSGNARMK